MNIYPKDDLGAITISFHSGITFPLEKTKQLILEMNQIADTPDHVTMTDKGAFVEFTHEYLDKKSNVHWFAKAIRKNNDLFLVTVNCANEVWESKKGDYFTAVTSFEIKK